MKRSLLILILIVAGCGPPMTRKEKLLFGAMLAGQWADYETSRRLGYDEPHTHFYERNPILGKHPSQDELAIFKIGVAGMFWALGEIWPENRESFFIVGALFGGGIAIHNDALYYRYK